MDAPHRKKTPAAAALRTSGLRARPAVPAATSRFVLPTVAALASLLCVATPRTAHAIIAAPSETGVSGDTGGDANDGDANDDAGDADGDAGDAASCPPIQEPYPIAGAMPPVQVHGGGCGCNGADHSGGVASLGGAAVGLAAAISRRRRSQRDARAMTGA